MVKISTVKRKFYLLRSYFELIYRVNSTDFGSNGMMRKPEGRRGASSGNISSIGANTSSEQAPTAFSSIPLQICKRKSLGYNMNHFCFFLVLNIHVQATSMSLILNLRKQIRSSSEGSYKWLISNMTTHIQNENINKQQTCILLLKKMMKKGPVKDEYPSIHKHLLD